MMIMIFTVKFNIGSSNALAVYQEKPVRTNVNKVNPLFKENIENYQRLEIDTDKLVKSAKEQAANNNIGNLPAGKGAAKNAINLSKKSHLQARSLGRQKQLQEKDEDNIFIDYDSSIFKGHKKDADKIISATGKLLENLLSKLKDIGVDCKEIKGNKITEPEYHLKLKKEKVKNLHYNKAVCEQPKNKYICHDFLKVKCIKRGKKWGKWQNRTKNFSGTYIYWNHYWWTCQHRHNLSWGRYMHFIRIRPDAKVQKDIQHTIAAKLGVSSDHIHPDIEAKDGGSGETIYVRWGDYVYPFYIFNYKYRDRTKPICTEWQEVWEQECKMQ